MVTSIQNDVQAQGSPHRSDVHVAVLGGVIVASMLVLTADVMHWGMVTMFYIILVGALAAHIILKRVLDPANRWVGYFCIALPATTIVWMAIAAQAYIAYAGALAFLGFAGCGLCSVLTERRLISLTVFHVLYTWAAYLMFEYLFTSAI